MTELSLGTVEIELRAIAENLALLRGIVRPGTRIYGVVKGDAYGLGLERVAATLVEAGIDGIAAGDPDEAMAVKAAHPSATVVAYGTYAAATALELGAAGVRPTLFSHEMAAEVAALATAPLTVHLEVDCGFGRLGFLPGEASDVFTSLSRNPLVRVAGLYTHLGAIEDRDAVAVQARRYRETFAAAEAMGFSGLERMANSSRTALDHPDLSFDAINPGRLLYGLLEAPWRERAPVRPAIAAVRTRLIQVKDVVADRFLGYGAVDVTGIRRCGIAAIGFAGGLPRALDGAPALLRGVRTRVIGGASMEHLIVDTTGIPDAAAGDELVLVGQQGGAAISGAEFSAATGLSELELLPRLARGLRRVYR